MSCLRTSAPLVRETDRPHALADCLLMRVGGAGWEVGRGVYKALIDGSNLRV